MKECVFILVALLSSYFSLAQNMADFENLSMPAQGFYNGSSDHSGALEQTESFNYQSGPFEFSVTYTPYDGYEYWWGMAFSNQTDLETADWTSYSAYANAPDGGGVDNSSQYGLAYFDYINPFIFSLLDGSGDLQIAGAYLCNHSWTYHYMQGTDGSASPYTQGDYYKLIFTDNLQNSVEFYLADFTNGNEYILDDWTFVDLSSLEGNSFTISYENSDEWTPTYFCIDNITADNPATITPNEETDFKLYPNPAGNYLYLTGITQGASICISDISGRKLKEISCENAKAIDISDLPAGLYILRNKTEGTARKFIKR